MKFEEIWSKHSKKLFQDKHKIEKIPPFKTLVVELNQDCEQILQEYKNLSQYKSDSENYIYKIQSMKLVNKLNCLKKYWKNIDKENIFLNDPSLRSKFISLAKLLDQVQLQTISIYQKEPFVHNGLNREISDFKELFSLSPRPQKVEDLMDINTKLRQELEPILRKAERQPKTSSKLNRLANEYFKETNKGLFDLNQFLYQFTLDGQEMKFKDQLQLAKFNLYINITLSKITEKKDVESLMSIMLIILDQLKVIEKTVQTSAIIDLKQTLTAYLSNNESFIEKPIDLTDSKISNWKNRYNKAA